jgi:hypothetical protein
VRQAETVAKALAIPLDPDDSVGGVSQSMGGGGGGQSGKRLFDCVQASS